MGMCEMDRIFPLEDGEEVSDKDLRSILGIATGGPVPMLFPEDTRCCGDHPGDWDREAKPGHSFCQECLDRMESP
jgi:hypothetical protein